MARTHRFTVAQLAGALRFEDHTERDRHSFGTVADGLTVHGHSDRAEIVAARVFRLEHDRGHRGVDFRNAARAFVAYVGRAAHRSTDEELRACGAQLVLVALFDGA